MSEIKSISEGTFVIGDTKGLTLEAGSGITVSQPSEGTVRIGKDETVIWSGTRSWWDDTSDLTISEPLSNFETIKIIVKDDWELTPREFYFPGDNTAFDISLIGKEDDNLVIKSSKFGISNNKISLTSKGMCSITSSKTISTTNWQSSFIQFSKIIGINRISGGNNE